ncbi:MAG TPA: hypothetical protein VIL07_12430 [Symbiobacteriaceae bacterium]
MPRQGPWNDELALRREARKQRTASEAHRDESLPPLGWKDTLAMILAAYQVLLPTLLGMFAAFAAIFLLFRWAFP